MVEEEDEGGGVVAVVDEVLEVLDSGEGLRVVDVLW